MEVNEILELLIEKDRIAKTISEMQEILCFERNTLSDDEMEAVHEATEVLQGQWRWRFRKLEALADLKVELPEPVTDEDLRNLDLYFPAKEFLKKVAEGSNDPRIERAVRTMIIEVRKKA